MLAVKKDVVHSVHKGAPYFNDIIKLSLKLCDICLAVKDIFHISLKEHLEEKSLLGGELFADYTGEDFFNSAYKGVIFGIYFYLCHQTTPKARLYVLLFVL